MLDLISVADLMSPILKKKAGLGYGCTYNLYSQVHINANNEIPEIKICGTRF